MLIEAMPPVSAYLNALGDMRAVVQAATQDFARGDLGQLIKSPKRLTGLPGGSIIGSVLGGLAGSLFGGKPKEYGSSTIAIGNGQASAGTAIGKGSAERETASALGGSVAQGLNQIAAALGGSLSGSAAVSIGYRPGHKAGAYRVDTTGAGRVTGVEAFETEAEAIAFAIRDAIADGAVKGLSSAVAKALQSSTDVDKAVAEAVKVQQLETALGGVAGQLSAIFRQFDADAAERVRLAKAYGLDLLAVEKLNAEQRADLLENTLTARVGQLQSLLIRGLRASSATQEGVIAELRNVTQEQSGGIASVDLVIRQQGRTGDQSGENALAAVVGADEARTRGNDDLVEIQRQMTTTFTAGQAAMALVVQTLRARIEAADARFTATAASPFATTTGAAAEAQRRAAFLSSPLVRDRLIVDGEARGLIGRCVEVDGADLAPGEVVFVVKVEEQANGTSVLTVLRRLG